MNIISIREPECEDESRFLKMTQASQQFHYPWVSAPLTHDEFMSHIQRYKQSTHKSFIVITQDNNIIGVFNISEIVRGSFQSAYLGFYAASEYAGQGLMSKGLKLVLNEVFGNIALHRIEANVQPANFSSINLISKNGFRKEGFSPRYLNINNQWCDHERWAITIEDWQKKDD